MAPQATIPNKTKPSFLSIRCKHSRLSIIVLLDFKNQKNHKIKLIPVSHNQIRNHIYQKSGKLKKLMTIQIVEKIHMEIQIYQKISFLGVNWKFMHE